MPGSARPVPLETPLGQALDRSLTLGLRRAARANGRPVPRWIVRLLSLPLLGKLAGANAVIVVAVLAAAFAMHGPDPRETRMLLVLAAVLAGSLLVNLTLVSLALTPLRELESTARRVWLGQRDARVGPSIVADRDMARIGGTMNLLLDKLTSDRSRMRRLAAEIIHTGDRTRAALARELHDSTAQTVAALVLQIGAEERDVTDPGLAVRLAALRMLAVQALEEIRTLAHTVHPRVLDDLGLPAALGRLAREYATLSGAEVRVELGAAIGTVAPPSASVLYRVAQEAVGNAVKHAGASTVTIRLGADAHAVRLEVIDDGRGFDVEEAERERAGLGLFTMRERLSLVDGTLDVDSHAGAGTRVIAVVPNEPLPTSPESRQ